MMFKKNTRKSILDILIVCLVFFIVSLIVFYACLYENIKQQNIIFVFLIISVFLLTLIIFLRKSEYGYPDWINYLIGKKAEDQESLI